MTKACFSWVLEACSCSSYDEAAMPVQPQPTSRSWHSASLRNKPGQNRKKPEPRRPKDPTPGGCSQNSSSHGPKKQHLKNSEREGRYCSYLPFPYSTQWGKKHCLDPSRGCSVADFSEHMRIPTYMKACILYSYQEAPLHT